MSKNSSSVSERESQNLWATKLTKCVYQDDQQVKLKKLQAEVDCLLQQLEKLKQQRLAATGKDG